MTELERYIRNWESVLKDSRPLFSPSTQTIIEGTIKSLKELQKLRRE